MERTRIPRRSGWRAGAAVVALLTWAGCSSNRTPFQGATPTGDQEAVHEAVVRFIVRYYQPAERAGAVRAWCLAVGRRSGLAYNAFYRGTDEPWNPSNRLLARLSDVDPRVIPVAQCGQDAGLQERVLESNEPAVLLIVSHPTWETHDRASVFVGMRENPSQEDGARCRVVRGAEGWRVRDCV